MTMKYKTITTAMLLSLIFAGISYGQCCGSSTKKASKNAKKQACKVKDQENCPVKGKTVDKNIYLDVKGKRVYVCSKSCLASVKEDPDKFLKVILEKGEQPQPTPKTACKKGGQEKETPTCGAEKAKQGGSCVR